MMLYLRPDCVCVYPKQALLRWPELLQIKLVRVVSISSQALDPGSVSKELLLVS